MEVSRIVVKIHLKGGLKLDKVIYPEKFSVSLEDIENILESIASEFRHANTKDFAG